MQGLYFTFKISLIYEIFEHNYVQKFQIYSLFFFAPTFSCFILSLFQAN